MPKQIFDPFDSFDPDTWNRSDFAVAASWNQTAWESDYVTQGDGVLRLRLDGEDKDGKPFTGAEIQSEELFSYGSFEMRLQTSGEPGTVSSFFLYTDQIFGASEQNEIDFEFLGNNPSQVSINYYYGDDKFANYIEEDIELGFDASADFHDYRIGWTPDAIRWFADDRLIYEVRADDAPLPIPDKDMLVYSSLWTGDSNLEDWHGPVDQEVDTSMTLDSFSYTPATVPLPVDQTGAVTFAGTSEALVIDMAAETYSEAAKVLAIGDSLTVGFVNSNDPTMVVEELDGYRLDLFDSIVQAGGWFDYVGFLENGPDGMMDRAHSAVAGTPLRDIIKNNSAAGPVDLSDNLDAFSPEVVLFMAGTNDFNKDEEIFFDVSFPNLMNNLDTAIDQFLAMPGSEDAYFVVSTLAPKLKARVPEIFADYLNQGYSIVDGEPVVGDAGNGTYQPGIIATVGARTATDPNILLFNNPVDVTGLSPDEVHFTEAAYAEYAADLSAFLQSEIGLSGGTFGGEPQFLQPTRHLVGSDAGDRVVGTDGNDTIDGGGGADYIDAGAGADTILFGGDTLAGTLDKIAGFSISEGDRINLSKMAEDFGWSASQTLANLVLEDVATGVRLKIDTGSTIETFAEILDHTAATIGPVIGADPLPSADDDRNLSLTAPDLFIDDTEAFSVDVSLSGLDADATGVIKLTDGTYSLTRAVRSDGTYSFDISGMADGAITTSITASTVNGESLTLPGDTISLAGPMPPSADDDRNLVVSAPDLLIRATEAGSTTIGISGLDGDATAVVTASDGISTVSSGEIGADGTVTLDISSLLDGPVTTRIVATDTGGATTTTSGPTLTLDTRVDTTADEAPFLSLSAPDASIDASEVGAVAFTLAGLDADATAVITVGDGSATVTSGAIAADGAVTLDLSALADGALTSSVTATDDAGNIATVAGPGLTLATAPDESADADGNLALSAPDASIDASEVGAVAFTLAGLDADATAVITVGDGSATVTSGAISADGAVTLDLSALADGALTSSVTATDDAGNTASVAGPGLTLDTTPLPPAPEIEGDVIGTSGDDTLRGLPGENTTILGLAGRDLILGDDGDDIIIGGADPDKLRGGSGADTFVFLPEDLPNPGDDLKDFSLAEGDRLELRDMLSNYDGSSIAGHVRIADQGTIGRLEVDADGGGDDYVPLVSIRDGRGLDAQELWAGDDLVITSAGPPPDTGDDDGNLALSAPDASIDASEVGAVAFTLAGLDADATAVITVGDGSATVTSGAIAADGAVTLDLSALADGALTSSVTATDDAGNIATVAGPGLTLATAPDESADADGNLALSAPDASIDASEVGAVAFTLAGLDADATAVITVGDGSATVTSGAISADGTVTLDLSALADGALTSSVTATDDAGNTASVAGPGLTLDTTPLPPAPEIEGDVIGTSGDDTLRGLPGENTTILGLAGRDLILGDDGDDIIIGGADPDKLRGGSGADTFVFLPEDLPNPGDDLKDFSRAEGDRLELRDMLSNYDGSSIAGHVRIADQGTIGRLEVDADGGGDDYVPLVSIRDGRGLDAQELWAGDDLVITSAGPPPDTGDDDGNLALSAPDASIDASEVGAVAFTLAGLDADATAVITVGDGSATVTSGAIAADGTVTLDLSALADGALTSSVTATDDAGNIATVAGPGLTLATAPDESADADGNLALSAPDASIDASEVGAVAFTLAGLDADATAVITVGDGSTTVTSGAISADGTVTLDLSALADGALTSSVTATDDAGNTASVAGPGLTLDTTPLPPAPEIEGDVIGTSGDDTLRGLPGENTTILGLAGRDLILGDDGDDIIIGGADPDKLRGGSGADTFVFLPEDLPNPGDDLKDFSRAEGDRLELRDMLSNYDGSSIAGHVRIADQGTIGRLEVDADGGGDDYVPLVSIRDGRGLDAQELWAGDDLLVTF